jgi:integrase
MVRRKWGERDPDEGCARCGRTPKTFNVRWPEGPLCARCLNQARWRRGTCAGCDVERQLPGVADNGDGLCRDCGSIPIDQNCSRCGDEQYLHRGRLCARCSVNDRLDELFPGPSPLEPLIKRLRSAESANATRQLLDHGPHTALLVAIHRGEVECTHQMLDERFTTERQVAQLRALLVLCGLLEERNVLIDVFERRAHDLIAPSDQPDDRELLTLFLRWVVVRRLRSQADNGTLTQPICDRARQRLRTSIRFVDHLRDAGTNALEANQGDLDRWLAVGNTTHCDVAAIVGWLRDTRRNPRLKMPTFAPASGDELSQAKRLKLLARYFTDDATPMDVRVAGLLYLLLAMPIARTVTLTRDDIVVDGETRLLRNGRGVVPLPAQLGALIEQQFAASRHRNTSAHDPTAKWLMPGRQAGQHLTAVAMRKRLRHHGLPQLRPGRHSAVATLVAELPAPLAADVADLAHDRSGYARRGL